VGEQNSNVGEPTRDMILSFLRTGIDLMWSDSTRQLLQDPYLENIEERLIELQKAGWDVFGVDRELGCTCLARVKTEFPGDSELADALSEFVHTAQRCFLQAVYDRAPSHLEQSARMPRDLIIQFFHACNTQIELPEFQERLIGQIQRDRIVPNGIIIEMQRGMLEKFGFERNHGCRQLNLIHTNYPNDKELHVAFVIWQRLAHNLCMRLVNQYMTDRDGRDFIEDMFGPRPSMQNLVEAAQQELHTMTVAQKNMLLARTQKTLKAWSVKPPHEKDEDMYRMSDDEKLDFVTAQVALVSSLRQQWQKQQIKQTPRQTPRQEFKRLITPENPWTPTTSSTSNLQTPRQGGCRTPRSEDTGMLRLGGMVRATCSRDPEQIFGGAVETPRVGETSV